MKCTELQCCLVAYIFGERIEDQQLPASGISNLRSVIFHQHQGQLPNLLFYKLVTSLVTQDSNQFIMLCRFVIIYNLMVFH